MLTSIILAWFAVVFTVLTAVLYLVKRTGGSRIRKAFSRIHITVGVLLIVTGIIHGILAGNMAGATASDIVVAPMLFTWNWGTISLIAAGLLAVSYLLRKRLRKQWMPLHRVLTIALVGFVVLHISDVGIQLFDRFPAVSSAQAAAVEPAVPTDEITVTITDVSVDSEVLVEETNTLFSGATLIDGVYEGSAPGYKGTITVSVTVFGGQVTDIEILSENDTPSYFGRAEIVVDTILEEQSLKVDAVSGATYSSAGIINAVSDALSTAVDNGTLTVADFTYSDKRGGRGH